MKIKATVGAALLLIGTSALADPTTWSGSAINFGDQVWTSLRGTVNTAEIIGNNTSPSGSFAAFCAEIDAGYTTPFSGQSVAVSGAQADLLSKLFTGAGWKSWSHTTDAVSTKAQITALQVGVWEILNDATFDVTSGSFNINSDSNVASISATLSTWMSAGNTGMAGDIYRITDNVGQGLGSQDLIIAVPEPSTYALMIAGLAAVGFVARRRKSV